MGFRDSNLASREKEIARLKAELEEARANDEELEKKLAEAEADLEIERSKGGRIKRFFDERRKARMAREEAKMFRGRRRSFFSGFNMHTAFIGLVILFMVGTIASSIYHYATDIQEGVVTSKEYHPEETVCTTDSDNNVSCTTYDEYWTVDIAYEGQTATWRVSRAEYNRLHRGNWYCYTDILHSADDCHGPED